MKINKLIKKYNTGSICKITSNASNIDYTTVI